MANQREINKLIDAKVAADSAALWDKHNPIVSKLNEEIQNVCGEECKAAKEKILKVISKMPVVCNCKNVCVTMDIRGNGRSYGGDISIKPSKKLASLIAKRDAVDTEHLKANKELKAKADKVKETITLAGCRADVLAALKKYLG